jgi:hypothetical protein
LVATWFTIQGYQQIVFVKEFCGLMNCWIVSGCSCSCKQNLLLPVPVYISFISKLHIGAGGLSSPQTVRSYYEIKDCICVCVRLSVTAITYDELKIRAGNFGNSCRVILRFDLANIMKIFSSAKFLYFQTLLIFMWIQHG